MGGATQVPAALLDQLAHDGRLVLPLGDASGQLLELVRRNQDGFSSETLGCCHLAMLPWASRRPSSFPWRHTVNGG
jgi:protein-L-isoaspartate O-methyltransferase